MTCVVMLLALTTAEKIAKIPTSFWLYLVLGVLLVVGGVFFLRALAGVNKFVLITFVLIIASAMGFSWIYERNEPKFLTPIVDKLAGFFPTKAGYKSKQQTPLNP
jgi:hypothetical protein